MVSGDCVFSAAEKGCLQGTLDAEMAELTRQCRELCFATALPVELAIISPLVTAK